MGQAGHKVIMAEKDPTYIGLSLTRFSRYVNKYINLKARTRVDYVEELVRIWHKEKVDWFLPITDDDNDVEVTEASIRMEMGANLRGRNFRDELTLRRHSVSKNFLSQFEITPYNPNHCHQLLRKGQLKTTWRYVWVFFTPPPPGAGHPFHGYF